jgi:hypothetical protein
MAPILHAVRITPPSPENDDPTRRSIYISSIVHYGEAGIQIWSRWAALVKRPNEFTVPPGLFETSDDI